MEEQDYDNSIKSLFDEQQPTTKTYKVTETKNGVAIKLVGNHCHSLGLSNTLAFTNTLFSYETLTDGL